jgi:LPXTG-motif cell wall-anchored protein
VSTPRRSHRRWGLVPAALAGALAAAWLPSIPTGHAAGGVGFAPPTFVDMVKAGGEPLIIHSSKFGTLVYSSHEGTTHLDRVGVASQSTEQFLCPDVTTVDCYKNHVWIWTSDDNGATWTLRDQNLAYTGFSDPDLTEDAGGNIYDTGIDLANEAVYSSQDGGKTWPHGTTNCNEGDRPWLAGGKAGEVFMETDAQISGKHTVFHSSNLADSCDGSGLDDAGIVDAGTTADGGTWSGFGKGLYDHFDGSFIEPAQFKDASGSIVGVGISRLADASTAFQTTGAAFHPVELAKTPGVFSPFGAPQVLSMDAAENLYFAWDTDDRDSHGKGGCSSSMPNSGGGPTPLANRIMLEVGKHVGPGQWQFEKPISLAHQGNARVLWPWSVAGSAGNLSVVWYQMDKMVDPDCDVYNNQTVPDVKTSIYEAHITNAIDPGTRHIDVTNASGRFIHEGGICDSGTTCVATGQDRRLGDYFTNSVDSRGCVVIASGDTTVPDPLTGQPRVTSLPIFIRQNSGPSLTGNDCGSTTAVSATAAPTATVAAATASPTPHAAISLPNTASSGAGTAGAAGAGALAIGAALLAGRRRRRRRGRRGGTGA